MRIEVRDRGKGFVAPVQATLDPDLSIGGYGLEIVSRLSTDWGITLQQGRTLVWAELPLRDG